MNYAMDQSTSMQQRRVRVMSQLPSVRRCPGIIQHDIEKGASFYTTLSAPGSNDHKKEQTSEFTIIKNL